MHRTVAKFLSRQHCFGIHAPASCRHGFQDVHLIKVAERDDIVILDDKNDGKQQLDPVRALNYAARLQHQHKLR